MNIGEHVVFEAQLAGKILSLNVGTECLKAFTRRMGLTPEEALAGITGGDWVLNQKQMTALLNGAGGGRDINVKGEFRLRGSDLVATVNRTIDQTIRRTGRVTNPYKQ